MTHSYNAVPADRRKFLATLGGATLGGLLPFPFRGQETGDELDLQTISVIHTTE